MKVCFHAWLILIGASLLTGACSHRLSVDPTPLIVPCLTSDQIPKRPANLGPPLPKTHDEASRRMAIKLIDWKIWADQTQVLLQACLQQE